MEKEMENNNDFQKFLMRGMGITEYWQGTKRSTTDVVFYENETYFICNQVQAMRIGRKTKREFIPIVLKTIFQYGYR